MVVSEKKYIDIIHRYAELIDGVLNLNTIRTTKKECYRVSNKPNPVVVKIGIQLEIPTTFCRYFGNVSSTKVLIPKCWCVIYSYRYNKNDFQLQDDSFKLTAKSARDSFDGYQSGKNKVIRCSITLLTQLQHLKGGYHDI